MPDKQSHTFWKMTHIKLLQELDAKGYSYKEISKAIEEKFGIVYTMKQIGNARRDYSPGGVPDRRYRYTPEMIKFLEEKYRKGLKTNVIVLAFNNRFPDRRYPLTYWSLSVLTHKNRDKFPRRNKVRKNADTQLRNETEQGS